MWATLSDVKLSGPLKFLTSEGTVIFYVYINCLVTFFAFSQKTDGNLIIESFQREGQNLETYTWLQMWALMKLTCVLRGRIHSLIQTKC